MHKKYLWMLLIGLQGLVSCREPQKEPDLTLTLVGAYEGGFLYGPWYGWNAPARGPESRPCRAQLYKVDNNTVGFELNMSDRLVAVEADVLPENQVYRLVVQPVQLSDREVAGIADPDHPGYHGTFDPARKELRLHLQETKQGQAFSAQMSVRKP